MVVIFSSWLICYSIIVTTGSLIIKNLIAKPFYPDKTNFGINVLLKHLLLYISCSVTVGEVRLFICMVVACKCSRLPRKLCSATTGNEHNTEGLYTFSQSYRS